MRKNTNQTFSLPINLAAELHAYVGKRGMSHFVAEAIRESLERKKLELEKAYLLANEDEGQIESMKDWQSTNMDGLND